MALRNRVPAFLFGFALQITVVVMSFVGFPGPTTPFEDIVQRFADSAGWMVIPAGISAVFDAIIFLVICLGAALDLSSS